MGSAGASPSRVMNWLGKVEVNMFKGVGSGSINGLRGRTSQPDGSICRAVRYFRGMSDSAHFVASCQDILKFNVRELVN